MKEAKELMKKYLEMSKNSEYVSIGQVVNDLQQLIGELRLKRVPKHLR